ncbi:TPM domain-containing protein [Microbacterium enclense]|uniref:TPM domain-containing protein n=1 Tax=Microbacterium enclense TaxID=993073 RepID=UPI003D759C58
MHKPKTAAIMTGLVIAAASVLGLAAPAWAVPPPPLGSSYVLDQADILTNAQEAEVQSRLLRLSEQTGLDLWVVFVDDFTEPASAADWANQAANRNQLGPHQYLLAVSIDGRAYYLSGDVDDGPLTADQLAAIEQERVQPALTAGDYAGAADAAATGITAAARGAEPAQPPAPAGSGPDVALIALVVFLVLALGGGLLWLWLRRRRGAPAGANAPAESIDDLSRRAGSALVATDDAVKTSEQELGFARAQFGDDAAAPYAEALAQAKADLDRAFTISQQLDDDVPETAEQRRAGYVEILRLCTSADDALDAKAAAFAQLRALESDAPGALARARERQALAVTALNATERDLASLRERYADDALATVTDNPPQAHDRLDLAAQQFDVAERAIAAGSTGEAAVAIRAAEAAISQAEGLEKAVTSLADDLSAAERRAADLVAEIEGDLATADALRDPDGRIAGAVATARTQLDAGRAALTPPRTAPLRALAALEQGNAAIDAAMGAAQDAAESRRRAESQLDALLVQARSQVSATEDFISARRGAIGPTARTRLAEAGAALVQAEQLRSADPVSALPFAQRAAELAGQAASLAQNDVGAFGGGRGGNGGGGDMMGAILGGIAVNALLGGGSRSRGGFGGGGLGGMLGGGGILGGGGGFGGGSRSGGSRGRSGGSSSGGSRARRGGGRF